MGKLIHGGQVYAEVRCGDAIVTFKFTHTSVALTHYNGDWRNVYCDIKGIKDNIW